MSKPVPVVALIVPPRTSAFHFAVPLMVFSMELAEGHLFDLKVIAPGGQPLQAERALTVVPDGGLELTETADILVVPSWHDLGHLPRNPIWSMRWYAHMHGVPTS